MSVVVTVAAAGTVVVGGKIFAGLATAAAASMGLKLVEAAEQAAQAAEEQEAAAERAQIAQELEVSVATEAALTKAVAERCRLVFTDAKVRLVITRDIRGKVTVTARGQGLSRAEVTQRAEALLGKIRQQVAYREVVTRMKAHGFDLAQEQSLDDGTVRVKLRVKRS